MRLVNVRDNIDILFEEGSISVIVIENQHIFGQDVGELWRQIGGETGDWILSESEKTLQLSKSADIVFNPFSIDINDRKVLSKLYSEISDIALEKYLMDLNLVNGKIIELLSMVVQEVPYFISFDMNIDFSSLLKMYNVKLDSADCSLLERLIDYIRALHNICKITIFVFVNLKNYLDAEELEKLYEFLIYEKVYVLLIEGNFSDPLKYEKILIFDKDACIISL